MSNCEKCHNTGKVTCPECGGEKKVECTKCGGHGEFDHCEECNSTGKVACRSCDGSGRKISICPVCDHGKITKSRWINCAECHGKGEISERWAKCPNCSASFELGKWGSRSSCSICGYHYLEIREVPEKCDYCDGRGQQREEYNEICPNCHGEYRRKTEQPCEKCGGTGKQTCSKCNGTGHAKCYKCDGTGETECGKCYGKGEVRCPDCEQREKERKRLEEEQRKREKEAAARRRREAYEKEQARQRARQRAKRRLGIIWGILWRITLAVAVGFLFWWWLERQTWPGMMDLVKRIPGGVSENLKLAMMVSGGVFVALYVLKLIFAKVSIRFGVFVQSVAMIVGGISATVLFVSGHWGVGGLMALALLGVLALKSDGDVYESSWRWILMCIGLGVSGAFGMNGNWIISSLITLFSAGLLVKN